jgi:hypothetical protein
LQKNIIAIQLKSCIALCAALLDLFKQAVLRYLRKCMRSMLGEPLSACALFYAVADQMKLQ